MNRNIAQLFPKERNIFIGSEEVACPGKDRKKSKRDKAQENIFAKSPPIFFASDVLSKKREEKTRKELRIIKGQARLGFFSNGFLELEKKNNDFVIVDSVGIPAFLIHFSRGSVLELGPDFFESGSRVSVEAAHFLFYYCGVAMWGTNFESKRALQGVVTLLCVN